MSRYSAKIFLSWNRFPVYILLNFTSRQNTLACAQRASKKKSQGLSHFESTFWRYAGMVAGIHCRGEDLAFFPPRLFLRDVCLYL